MATLVTMSAAGCAGDAGPRLDEASPSAAGRNGTVLLTGRRLCGERSDCATAAGEVQLGLGLPTVRATVLAYSDTSASIVIPSVTPVGASEIVVTVNEDVSNALAFEVLP